MGQHSNQPSRQTPLGRLTAPGKRKWTALAAGVAVVAAASTTAWAAVANGDQPQTTNAIGLAAATTTPTAASTTNAVTPSPSAKSETATPKPDSTTPKPSTSESTKPTTSSQPKPPSAAAPKTTKSPEHKPKPRATPKTRVISSGTCGASFYGDPQMTASGERFDPSAMTAAHKTLPLGSRVRVTNPNNGESVIVRINDRGPYVGGRCLDLSEAAFDAIGSTSAGVMTVKYEVLAR